MLVLRNSLNNRYLLGVACVAVLTLVSALVSFPPAESPTGASLVASTEGR